ncbi:3'-5' exonuclease KapD [Hazenella coriacea]|uniref:Sporulation inhibitor KapD n=1 Tax=Hazenella coriacea TaxID=1179467 RepID=A0A4R3L6P5_9BACL|nr:3'-5' exonuclease KapD [Hazenella coriacea]TCS95561.1 sporulation inhibitor KapD [Hazenella coriacea]
MGQQSLFIDFEFSMPEAGTKKGRRFFPEIIEVGLVCVVDDQIEQTYSSFVTPKLNSKLSERCKKFLNISQKDVDRGISFEELVNCLSSIYGGSDTRIITWGNMDMHVLYKSCARWNITYPFRTREIDLSMEFKNFYGDQNQTGLMKALHQFGRTSNRQHHRALDDAMTTYEIFRLVEKDKSYLQKNSMNRIGDCVDLARLFENLA